MIRRVIVILDALRRDTAKWILMQYFDAKFHEVVNMGVDTTSAFSKIYPLINSFNGWKCVITGGGFASTAFKASGIEVDHFDDKEMYPLLMLDRVLPKMPPMDRNALIVVHDYFIHNYFSAVSGVKKLGDFTLEYKEQLVAAYARRTLAVVPYIQQEKKRFVGWEFYITADHGEAIGENGKWHHGLNCREVSEGFIIDFQRRDALTQEMLFKGD